MKRTLAILIGLSLILPTAVLARVASDCNDYCRNLNETGIEPPSGQVCICNPLTATSFEAMVDKVINFFFTLSLALVPLIIIIGAFYILTAGGDPKKVATGREIIVYSLIAFAIILLAKGLVAMIKNILMK
jgi:magnesium-transporting ATPase (P-type)